MAAFLLDAARRVDILLKLRGKGKGVLYYSRYPDGLVAAAGRSNKTGDGSES